MGGRGRASATVAINFVVSAYERRRGRELKSSLLTADASHTLTDGLAASVVLGAFGAIALGLPWADLLAAAVVCLFIGKTAWQILRQNLGVLIDEAALDPARVRDVAMSVTGVLGVHKIRSRGASDDVQVDLHVHLNPSLPLADAHAKSHQVADAIALRSRTCTTW